MAELDFERRLERLFGEAAPQADAEAFAERVQRRLARRWTVRRGLIGAAGVAGGLIGVTQLALSGGAQRLGAAAASAHAVSATLVETPPGQWLSILPSDAGVVWTAVGVAAVLLGFVLTRVIEEI